MGGEPVDDRLKQLIKELGDAINESISSSEAVNAHIQKMRDEGYDLYVFLDATIGVGRDGEAETVTQGQTVAKSQGNLWGGAHFRINLKVLRFLRSVGIDPTRKVKVPKRLNGKTANDDPEG